jgi:hypothetical protein
MLYDNNFWFLYETKLRGFSPQANYTDRATAACGLLSYTHEAEWTPLQTH